MKMSEAAELREMYRGMPCEHQNLEKEYHLGTATGDYVCTTCGKTGWGRDWADKEK